MKKLLIAALLCGMATVSFADDQVNVLFLDGTSHVMKMTDVDKIELSAATINVVKTGGQSQTFNIKDIDKIELGNVTSSVEQIKNAAKGDILVKANGYAFEIAGLADGDEVAVYAENGSLVGKAKAIGGSAQVDASGYAGGVYIIKAGGRSLKMVKK